jgi:hypothetical protein
MPRDGAGTYTLPNAPFVSGTVANPTPVNGNFSDIASEITGSLARNGTGAMSAPLPMGGQRATNLGNATARTDAAAAGQVQDGGLLWAGTTGGTATAITATLTPTITAYATGMTIAAKIGAAGGVNPTLNINGVGAKKVYVATASGAAQATTGDLFVGDLAAFRYDAALDGGAGGWLITSAPATGWRVISVQNVSSVANVDFAMPLAYRRFRLTFENVTTSAAAQLAGRFSSDGGSTFLSTASYQQTGMLQVSTTQTLYDNAAVTSIALTGDLASPTSFPAHGLTDIMPGSVSVAAALMCAWRGIAPSPAHAFGRYNGAWGGAAARMTAFRILPASGTVSGVLAMEGMR